MDEAYPCVGQVATIMPEVRPFLTAIQIKFGLAPHLSSCLLRDVASMVESCFAFHCFTFAGQWMVDGIQEGHVLKTPDITLAALAV